MTSPQLTVETAAFPAVPENILVLYAKAGPTLSGEAERLFAATGADLATLAGAAHFSGKPGEVLDLIAPQGLGIDRLLIIGAPQAGDDDAALPPTARIDQGGAAMGRIMALKAEKVTIVADEAWSAAEIADFVAGLRLRHYRFDMFKTKRPPEEESKPLAVTLSVADKVAAEAAIAPSVARVEGVLFARDLINLPPNHLGPEEFAEKLSDLETLGLKVEILTEAEMSELGMGALLAVGQGSSRPSRLVVMRWEGGDKDAAPIAFVGKGVVFDTGGISIKPAPNMEAMKGDMGGAAAVAGVMKALALRKARANVVGVVGLVENMPDGKSYRPGDILSSMSGQTIEVVNTDAEGRLVLADALFYTQDRFKPEAMIDLATLTGAIMVGLGQDYAGLFSNNDELAETLFEVGMATGEKLWRMPMGPAYDKLIDSRFADMKNSGGRHAGAITAAQLLKRFVGETVWAHLDIAGTGLNASTTDINTSWGPGFGVRLLDAFVAARAES